VKAIVVDVSLALKWVLVEADSESALRVLTSGVDVHAPDFLLVEAANVLWKKSRRGQLGGDAHAVLATLREAPIALHVDLNLLDRALELGLQTGRTVYDCLYLALAERLDTVVVTADERFVNALSGTAWRDRAVTLQAWVADLPAEPGAD
jgi:predicted nucleic acid-binding protein